MLLAIDSSLALIQSRSARHAPSSRGRLNKQPLGLGFENHHGARGHGWRAAGRFLRYVRVIEKQGYRMTVHSRQLPVGDIEALVKALGVQERVLLFCLGSGTDWKQAGITLETVAGLVFNFVVTPRFPTYRLALTDRGRAALRELLRDL
jgi:hypothetical protein